MRGSAMNEMAGRHQEPSGRRWWKRVPMEARTPQRLSRRVRAGARDAGMVTSEYAMGLIAAVGFAGLLYKVVTSGQVKAALQAVVEKALDVPF